jgi:DNA-binding beta-propeller fold protein YncE
VTEGLDLGESITLVDGESVPTSSDLATRLLRTFFIATNPSNWQDHAAAGPWHVTYPDVEARITGGNMVNLKSVLDERYGNDLALPPAGFPAIPGVGEVWVNTQFEMTAGKEKPGTATAVDLGSRQVTRKVALPDIDMNNPHNMWTDRSQDLIYQTEWFGSSLVVFDRKTGRLVDRISLGESPAHVMTRPDTDQVYVTINGADRLGSVVELTPGASGIARRVDVGAPHPHGHWISSDGTKLITPNVFTDTSNVYDLQNDVLAAIVPAGSHPVAIGLMPDAGKYYVANLGDSTLTVVDMETFATKTIDLLEHYDPISGAINGPIGGFPLQSPVSPDGRFVVTANTLTATITILDTETDTLIAMLPGDPGAHGVQFGAKQGGGYYAYVSNMFSNSLTVVDPDPNRDGDGADATIAGRITLTGSPETATDDTITAHKGMGGQGVLPIPVVYPGWVEKLPEPWTNQLTAEQRNPLFERAR